MFINPMPIRIRFGYCPPNPGPKKKLNNKWFINKEDAINEYNGEPIYVSYRGKYRKITFEKLLNL